MINRHLQDWIADLRVATGMLTRVPVPHPDGAMPPSLSRAQRVFPLVGALIGLAVGLVDVLLLRLGVPPLAAAALALGFSAALTGALHEDGLADVGDGFGGGRDRAAKLSIMRDSRLGTYGSVALLVGFATRWAALASLPAAAVVPGLIVAHALGRAAIPVLAATMPYARTDGLGKRAGRPETAGAVTAVMIAVVIALICLPTANALLALLLTAAGAAAVAALAWRQIGGVTGDVFGAAEQVAETAVLVLLAARLSAAVVA
ncbi:MULTISPECIES: adenosylcobinamide-GDP ribazoletransferase [Rhodopseudomonas]|uniref:Adenosylcobinamide-GDP ribazoletransferase n=1 Tax=Rhodopseudomonas palustris TaxID=1076 RepID=A0A0D7F2N3_RHOPL|nr:MULTISPECIES: adenosylcobinamide-GDP ribazoletransferase [Rhodopseudomonas]KIZ47294.1 cobalamin biosynthesis protein CobS [Rhodopseudomonas palustris]MDF3812511.1 adenosylcobinamide-GDP ribazoletransferase [Rhodopseudomonas sp. BAL398]WOK19901.1 adenosylcobinamide-GDP ribazoletransferase [Rhodopseudomonas sp. BAL398]